MTRTDVILMLIEQRNYTHYLEIGCATDDTFAKVNIPHKVGVDPERGGTLKLPSDEFFSLNKTLFDVIFIDGDHRHPQVFRDVANALRFLRPGGAIVMHDCLPPSEKYESPNFCGTAWRAFAKVRERPDLEAFTGDFDFGVGIIHVAPNSAPINIGRSMADLTYNDLQKNRTAWMRPVPAEDIQGRLTALERRLNASNDITQPS